MPAATVIRRVEGAGSVNAGNGQVNVPSSFEPDHYGKDAKALGFRRILPETKGRQSISIE